MRSAAFRPGPRHRLEARVTSFHLRLARMLAQAGLDAPAVPPGG